MLPHLMTTNLNKYNTNDLDVAPHLFTPIDVTPNPFSSKPIFGNKTPKGGIRIIFGNGGQTGPTTIEVPEIEFATYLKAYAQAVKNNDPFLDIDALKESLSAKHNLGLAPKGPVRGGPSPGR